MSLQGTVPTAFELFFQRTPQSDRVELEAREDRFFHSIELRNGTRKTTWHRRLDDLNEFVMGLLPMQRPLEIMDVAVSSGVSSAEWLEALERAGVQCRMVAGDAVVESFLISFGPRLRALADRTGHLMQLDIGGHAIRLPPPRRRDQLRYLPCIRLMELATRLFDLTSLPRGAEVRRWGVSCRALALLSPSLSQLPRLEAVEDDILTDGRFARRFHVLRAANILNLAYFDTDTLTRMVSNLRDRLLPGGLLIICRTSEQQSNDATVFTLGEDGRLRVAARLNRGSEIEPLALALRC